MATGAFERAYSRGVTEELGPPTVPRERALPTKAFSLHGSVITSDGSMSDGYVTVEGGLIQSVSRKKPEAVTVVDTKGVIVPGLLDMHNHPEFNVFAPWEPPQTYVNRYRWRDSDVYHDLVRDPQNKLIKAVPPRTQSRYAEVRALIAGVTGIQGASGASTSKVEPLVRNLDLWTLGQHKARSMIDLPRESGRDFERLKKILKGLDDGDITAFYLHLCEGQPGNEALTNEFRRFIDMDVATPATVVIHGSSLSKDDLHELADARCKLVWSPQSNLRLYKQTTLAGEAIAAGMHVALGADWMPSGSLSLLAEMKVARRELARQGHPVKAADLVAMVTSVAASIAGFGDKLGSLAPGRVADLVVFERHHDDPYENVCIADPSWVELVCIGGDITYGRADWFKRLSGDAESPTIEDLVAWGKPMRIDTGFQSAPDPMSLGQIRQSLTAAYPPVGPIFA
jgi:cytosine/adenosine deaminase-related metal-dependent hydrolase